MTSATATVFFDIGDSLIHVRQPLHLLYTNVINNVKHTEFDPEVTKKAMDKKLETMELRMQGHFRYSDAWFEMYIFGVLETIGCPKPWKPIMQPLFDLFTEPETFRVFPDVFPCLKQVRRLGLNAAVISNWGYRLPMLLERLGISPYFELIIASADVELEKPDPAIFELALSKMNGDPQKSVHIGDNVECDAEGARAVGIHGLLLDRNHIHDGREGKIDSLEGLFPFMGKKGII